MHYIYIYVYIDCFNCFYCVLSEINEIKTKKKKKGLVLPLGKILDLPFKLRDIKSAALAYTPKNHSS